MVVEVLVTERDPEHALANERAHPVLDQVRPARIREAGCEALDQADGTIRRPEQKRSRIGRDRPAIKAGLRYTVSASGSSSAARQGFVAEELSLIQSPDAPTRYEKSGLDQIIAAA